MWVWKFSLLLLPADVLCVESEVESKNAYSLPAFVFFIVDL